MQVTLLPVVIDDESLLISFRQDISDLVAAREEKKSTMARFASDFEAKVGAIINVVLSAAAEMEATASSLNATAEQTSRQVMAVAAASEQASTNVQSVASATEELSSPSVPTTVRHLPPGSLDPEDAEGSPRSCPCSPFTTMPTRVPPRTAAIG